MELYTDHHWDREIINILLDLKYRNCGECSGISRENIDIDDVNYWEVTFCTLTQLQRALGDIVGIQ